MLPPSLMGLSYEYIRIFIRIVFFFNTNIFGYSFVSKFHIRHTMIDTFLASASRLACGAKLALENSGFPDSNPSPPTPLNQLSPGKQEICQNPNQENQV